eukprot:4289431-Alexandrium_andersonii.AAC.1
MPHLCDFGRGACACATSVGVRTRATSVRVPVTVPREWVTLPVSQAPLAFGLPVAGHLRGSGALRAAAPRASLEAPARAGAPAV